jgi:hypothetical protein
VLLLFLAAGCNNDKATETGTPADTEDGWDCTLTEGTDSPFASQLGCLEDFDVLASLPLDASIPGARSVKTVVDRTDSSELYFMNSVLYPIHWEFASAQLSGDGLPIVPDLGTFNTTEYYSPDRRFILGAASYYEGPDVWVYEISPYDTAGADLIAEAFYKIQENSFFGADLYFHPTSTTVEAVAAELPSDIPIMSTDELYAGIDYQPLNLGSSMGQLAFYSAEDLETSYVNYRQIVVLDAVPNDISVTAGIITGTFQTPLAHINVLSQNRGTPNMSYRDAFTNEELLALEGKWVELVVEAQQWTIREVTQEEADAWWEENRPEPIDVEPMDTSVTGIWDTADILDLENNELAGALKAAIPAFGGKATHFAGMEESEDIPNPPGFAIPVYYYDQHMANNGLWDTVDTMLSTKAFYSDAATRDQMLTDLRDAIGSAPIDPELLATVEAKIYDRFDSGASHTTRTRFRSSTNAEDVNGFNGAGLYSSSSGDPEDDSDPVEDAIRLVWSSVWNYRAFEEREYYSIDHTNIGAAVLSHRSFPNEESNGVAITGNIFDSTGLEPAYYINVQTGGTSVVLPPPGITSDQLLYYYDFPNQPVVYIANNNLTWDDGPVLTTSEIYELGGALKAIHNHFYTVYGSAGAFYGMDVEFKFDNEATGKTEVYIKQARPYPAWGP